VTIHVELFLPTWRPILVKESRGDLMSLRKSRQNCIRAHFFIKINTYIVPCKIVSQ
jgi:hypothetical protein